MKYIYCDKLSLLEPMTSHVLVKKILIFAAICSTWPLLPFSMAVMISFCSWEMSFKFCLLQNSFPHRNFSLPPRGVSLWNENYSFHTLVGENFTPYGEINIQPHVLQYYVLHGLNLYFVM